MREVVLNDYIDKNIQDFRHDVLVAVTAYINTNRSIVNGILTVSYGGQEFTANSVKAEDIDALIANITQLLLSREVASPDLTLLGHQLH